MIFDNYIHIKWMRRAIKLAFLGKGLTSPNPLVGAVITNKFGDLISEGFHHKTGMPHAEAMAFDNLKKDPRGGNLYVNLEPCCHEGKTPPCVKRIIKTGIKKVFVSIKDPDNRVSGKGIKILRNAGIEVHLGLCETESLEINKAFIHRNLTGNSYGILKWAMSIDGRIGLKNGDSKWITNKFSRSKVHSLRAECDAVIIGGNTFRKDNPLLTTRGLKDKEPLRVVLTKSLNFLEKNNLWDCSSARTLVLYDSLSEDETKLKKIPSCVEIEKLPKGNLKHVSKLLANRGCNKVLWECGPSLATSAIRNGCIQETITFIAPKILGGNSAMTPFSDLDFKKMSEVIELKNLKMNVFDNDIYLTNQMF